MVLLLLLYKYYYYFYISEETGHGITFLRPGRVVHAYNPRTCEVALRGSGVKDYPQLHRERKASLGHRRAYLKQKQKLGVVVYTLSQHSEAELGASLSLRTVWSTCRVPDQPGLHSETLF